MAILLNDSIKVQGGKPVEDKRLNNGVPYTSVDQVNSLIIPTDRYISLEVLINDKIYWYKDGIEDQNLVEKLEGSQSKDLIRVVVDTPSATRDKVGTTTAGNYVPQKGDELIVDFTNGTWVNSPTLNIDGSGTKNIILSGRNPDRNNLSIGTTGQNKIVRLWYDGTNYQLYGATVNSTYGVIPQQALKDENNNYSYLISGAVVAWIRNWENILNKPELLLKTDIKNIIDVNSIDSYGYFKSPKGFNIKLNSDEYTNFSVGTYGSSNYDIISSFPIIEVSPRKLKLNNAEIDILTHHETATDMNIVSSGVRLKGNGDTLEVINYDFNDYGTPPPDRYADIKAKKFKVAGADFLEDKIMTPHSSNFYFYRRGVEYSDSDYEIQIGAVASHTIFLTGNVNKTIRLHRLPNYTILSFKKCFDGGNIDFQCQGKTIIKRGADSFNGADGSNAVISIVGNKCYIDINNYE